MKSTLYSPAWWRTAPEFFGRLLVLVVGLSAAVQGHAQPAVIYQPISQSVSVGATVQFYARGGRSANPPITYQWLHEDTPLVGATNTTLILTNVGLSHAGTYHAAVSDLSGTTDSDPALLDVDPTFSKITTDPLTTHEGSWHVGSCMDYDNDGYPDVLLSQTVGAEYLYHNDGNFNFTRIIEPSLWLPDRGAMGPAWDDFNNDGNQDLFVPNCLSPNQLLRGRGNGTFEPIRAACRPARRFERRCVGRP